MEIGIPRVLVNCMVSIKKPNIMETMPPWHQKPLSLHMEGCGLPEEGGLGCIGTVTTKQVFDRHGMTSRGIPRSNHYICSYQES